ncbi:unnamed protein product [Pleuronectes platessa]|uniref:Uncharacterized protein n=1 Tax=Pleuronectes platessa TaxID=8262 RepID=A0A9N7V3C7_PLEPL|nr:unnamed protein product [Pleuronectes platessa]
MQHLCTARAPCGIHLADAAHGVAFTAPRFLRTCYSQEVLVMLNDDLILPRNSPHRSRVSLSHNLQMLLDPRFIFPMHTTQHVGSAGDSTHVWLSSGNFLDKRAGSEKDT